jgi:hypothetical protein
MDENRRYINGVRIGDWFYRVDGVWLHYHKCAAKFTMKWHGVKNFKCLLCKQIVPAEVQVHGNLQQLHSTKDVSLETYWPVSDGSEKSQRPS